MATNEFNEIVELLDKELERKQYKLTPLEHMIVDLVLQLLKEAKNEVIKVDYATSYIKARGLYIKVGKFKLIKEGNDDND